MKQVYSSYLICALESPMKWRTCVVRAVERLTPFVNKFDAIAFRGMSGALLAPAVAGELNKQLLVVRKTLNNSHSSSLVEGVNEPCRYVILDDFVSSGDTAQAIQKEIWWIHPLSVCMGIYLYKSDVFYNQLSRNSPHMAEAASCWEPSSNLLKKRMLSAHAEWTTEYEASKKGDKLTELENWRKPTFSEAIQSLVPEAPNMYPPSGISF